MANEVTTLGLKQVPHMADRARTHRPHLDGMPGLLVLIPIGSLVLAALLILALARISTAPVGASVRGAFEGNAEVRGDSPIEDGEAGETSEAMMRLGLAGARR